jgi:hypothetical protein
MNSAFSAQHSTARIIECYAPCAYICEKVHLTPTLTTLTLMQDTGNKVQMNYVV